MKQSKENRKPYQDSEAGFHAELLLEKQRNQILSDAKSAIFVQILRVERSHDVIRELNRQFHSHHMETYHRDQENGASRRERASLHAELQRAQGHGQAQAQAQSRSVPRSLRCLQFSNRIDCVLCGERSVEE